MSWMEADEGQDWAKRYKICLIPARNVRNQLTQHGILWALSCAGELNHSEGNLHRFCKVSGVNLLSLLEISGIRT